MTLRELAANGHVGAIKSKCHQSVRSLTKKTTDLGLDTLALACVPKGTLTLALPRFFCQSEAYTFHSFTSSKCKSGNSEDFRDAWILKLSGRW